MTQNCGSASRAKEIDRLFAVWRRACDARDTCAMAVAMRVIDAVAAGRTPNEADVQTIRNYVRRGKCLSGG
jgi:hypothetical protein